MSAAEDAPPPLSRSFVGKSATPASLFEFFISSGSDVRPQRDQFEGLVRVFDNSFSNNRVPGGERMVLRTVRWEDLAAQRYSGRPNDRFVEDAKRVHFVVALLSSVVKPGTREEIEGVLETPATQLSVIVMPKDGAPLEPDLTKFLETNSRRFHYCNTQEPPEHPETARAMVGIISNAVADALNPDLIPKDFREDR